MKTKLLLVVIVSLIGGRSITAQEARFAELNGTVEFKNAGTGEWQPAAVGGLIGKDTIISTGIKSDAVISLGGSTVTISPVTMLTLEELIQRDGTEEATFYLRTGRIRADVTPPSGLRAEFTVRSPTTTASVRGTSFSFNGRRLSVHSGRVAFANTSGQKVYVNGNQRSYAEALRHQRLTLPFEAASAEMRPVFGDLDNTGSRRETPQGQTPQVDFIIGWN
jgi:hypothetical protein